MCKAAIILMIEKSCAGFHMPPRRNAQQVLVKVLAVKRNPNTLSLYILIMKIFKILILLSFWTLRLCAQTGDLKHDWNLKYLEDGIQFKSNKQAPVPFSTTGEPQAIMIIMLYFKSFFQKRLKSDC